MTPDSFDKTDMQRLGLLLMTAVDTASDRDIRVRRSKKGVWRVDVIHENFRKTTHSSGDLLPAMEGAVDWLRQMTKPLGRAQAVQAFLRGTIVALLLSVVVAVPAWAQGFTCTPALGTAPPGTDYACTTSFDSTRYSDGPHTLSVTATDAAGNTATATVNIIIDNTAPILVVTSPSPDQVVSRTFSVAGTARDATSKVQSVTVLVDGQPLLVSLAPDGSWVTAAGQTRPGQRSVSVTVRDAAGNAASTGFRVRAAN